ncbi:hypothetical protein ACFQJ5_06615 [Halomicroarcula sp. GCM10025324]|nr:hypothetical protein [Halomicroarcula sp. ZS-22-S1]
MSLRLETVCPLCGDDCGAPGQLRSHLHVHHRKSELVEVCLAASR